MTDAALLKQTYALLETDLLAHIVALKFLKLCEQDADVTLCREGKDWAMVARIPITVAPWDRTHYPEAAASVLVEASRPELVSGLLDRLPREKMVVKTGEPAVGRELEARGAKLQASILSFTNGPDTPSPAPAVAPEVKGADSLDADAVRMFGYNGYEPGDLGNYFRNGACRFWIDGDAGPAAACFVFRNYGPVWEIGGVYTEPDYRGRGFAKKLAAAALATLLDRGFRPRYQTTAMNTASLAVARSLGLKQFLRQEHWLWDKR
jgi:GNAT superfamily N-acetyltransferase